MPSTITHAYIGLDTIKNLNAKPKKILTNNVDNFKVYCQGTDILYFYKIFLLKGNEIQKLGHIFHNNKTLETFKYLININKKNRDYELFTFICGLITHYKGDSIMHPYINYLAHNDNRLEHINNHFLIETYIDNYLVHEKEKVNQKKYKNYSIVFNYTKKDIIVNTLNDMFYHFYQVNNIGNIYYKALKEMKFVFKYFRYDPLGYKKLLYSFIDLIHLPVRRTKYLSYNFDLSEEKYLNSSNNVWFNYKNTSYTSNKSLIELYDQVIKESTFIINNIYIYIFENGDIDLDKIIGNNSYSTGLFLRD